MNWIKIEISTPDKPEIYQMAELLGIDPDAVLGKLFRVWAWADTNAKPANSCNDYVTKNNYICNDFVIQKNYKCNSSCNLDAVIDRITHTKNFADCMRSVGWLQEKDGEIVFPNFARHNGKSAKTRLLNAERVKKHREKTDEITCNDFVTKNNYKTVTREEKRRGELKERGGETPPSPTTNKNSRFIKPTLEEITDYATSIDYVLDASRFFDFYEAKGWFVGKNKMKDWRSAVRSWRSRDAAEGKLQAPASAQAKPKPAPLRCRSCGRISDYSKDVADKMNSQRGMCTDCFSKSRDPRNATAAAEAISQILGRAVKLGSTE